MTHVRLTTPSRCDGALFWTIIGCVLVGTLAFLLTVLTPAHAHDMAATTDPQRGAWFESLKQPKSGTSCCNLTDCHQTQARQLLDHSWQAVMVDGMGSRWVDIPPDKVVTKPLSVDGEAYLCHSDGSKGGWTSSMYGTGRFFEAPSAGLIYCFVPPIPGF